jgi:pyruvate dehydrogenase E2 component (dihydrolipoamide acetyltransferase)
MTGRIRPLSLPKWGLIMTEGTLLAWRAEIGARLEPNTVVADIESEKIVNELAAHEVGVLRRQLVKEGGTCSVGTLIGVISEGDVSEAEIDAYVANFGHDGAPSISAALPSLSAPQPNRGSSRTQVAERGLGVASHGTSIPPTLKRARHGMEVQATYHATLLSRLWGVELSAVRGTGGRGRVTKADLISAILQAGGTVDLAEAKAAALMVPPPDPKQPATPIARRVAARMGIALNTVALRAGTKRIRKADVLAASRVSARPEAPAAAAKHLATGEFEERALTSMRRMIGQRLTQSKQLAPHFRLMVEVRVDDLLALGKVIADMNDTKVSLNDLLIKASAQSLMEVPGVNVHVIGDHIRYFKDAHVAVAVSIDGGLITPAVRCANHKSIVAIATEMRMLVAKAQQGKLTSEDVESGTFSISNLGMFGIRQFDAIINPPQGAILAVGAAQRRRIFIDDGEEVVAKVLTATLSCDHRAIDGVLGAQFLQAFKRCVETPAKMLS